MNHRPLPKIIQEVGFDFDWDEQKVWGLNLPVEEMAVSKLEWHFDIPFWWTKGGYYDLKPRSVIDHPNRYPARIKRIMNSDLSHPLDIMRWKGKWLLLDGLHRLVKTKMLRKTNVRVRKVPHKAISLIQK
jgi:hypothetical protein